MTREEQAEAVLEHLSEDGPAIIMNDEAVEIIQTYLGDCLCAGCTLLRAFIEQSQTEETQH